MPTFVIAQRPQLPRPTDCPIDLAMHKRNSSAPLPGRVLVDARPTSPRKSASPGSQWSNFGPKTLLKALGLRKTHVVERGTADVAASPAMATVYPERRQTADASLRQPPAAAAPLDVPGALAAESTPVEPLTAVAPTQSRLWRALNEVLHTEQSYNAGLDVAIKAYEDYLRGAQAQGGRLGAGLVTPARDVEIAQEMVRDLTTLKKMSDKLMSELEAALPIPIIIMDEAGKQQVVPPNMDEAGKQRYCSAVAELTTSSDFVAAMWGVVKNYKLINMQSNNRLPPTLCAIESGHDAKSMPVVQRLMRYPMMFAEIAKIAERDPGIDHGSDYAEVAHDLSAIASKINQQSGARAPGGLYQVSYTRGANAPVLPDKLTDALTVILEQNRRFAGVTN